jgi:hypothetical protein
MRYRWIGIAFLSSLVLASPIYAWGPQGHQTVGAIADELIAGTHAGAKVKSILGPAGTLQTAALWADCAKGVVKNSSTGAFHFVVNPLYAECAPFQTTAGKQAMVAFVKRNWDACHPKPDEEVCHKQYHYADVAIERNTYARTDVGTSDHDIVSAIQAAVAVLQGGSSPVPFAIVGKKEALRMLAHYIGDIHQPLHVGAIYLNAAGNEVDPDAGTFDPATKNQGGNLLMDGTRKLHGEWDSIPASLTVASFKAAGVAAAQLVPLTAGPVNQWPISWATDTVLAAHAAFQGLTFGAVNAGKWPVTEPASYPATRAALQRDQLVKAGAHFAQALKAIWPRFWRHSSISRCKLFRLW